MAAVKASKPTRLAVVPYRPYVRMLFGAAIAVMFVLVAIGTYLLGNHHGVAQQTDAIEERDRLRTELRDAKNEADALSQQVANLTLAREVDRASSEDVRNQVIELKDEIAALEEDISFYRGLMAPTDNRRGLAIGSVDVIATGVARRYDFKVVVQQFATDHQVLNGSLSVTVVGRAGEEMRRVPLMDLSPQVEEREIKLRFRYFQNIEGQIELPEGFEPRRIELVAKSTGRDSASVEERFGWLVHES